MFFFSAKIGGLSVSPPLEVFGLLLAALGTLFFVAAILAMKNNWRSGCDKNQNTSLVVSGPYKISRNPAFVGFDLLYIGCAIVVPNIASLIITFLAVAIFHAQVVEEEHFLETAFGQEYQNYKARVKRYFGRTGR